MQQAMERARILVEALPYIQEFAGRRMVIKLGGHAMIDRALLDDFARDIVLLKAVDIRPIIVHGGGPQIEQVLEKMGVCSRFVAGMRVTDDDTLDVVEMVLGGKINGDIVTRINLAGGKAVGLSGKDGNMIIARPYRGRVITAENKPPELIDLGHVGEVEQVNTEFVMAQADQATIPVIAPLGVDRKGQTYNINADLVAGSIAAALNAAKLILLTDVPGVSGENGELLSSLTADQARKLTERGVIKGGMIPKVQCCLDALAGGVEKTHIIDGRIPHSVILEIFTDAGVGTEICNQPAPKS